MNCVFDFIGDHDADFDHVPGLVRSNQHRKASLVIRAATGEGVLYGVPNVIIRDSMPASARKDLHPDKVSCQQRQSQESQGDLDIRSTRGYLRTVRIVVGQHRRTAAATGSRREYRAPTDCRFGDARPCGLPELGWVSWGLATVVIDRSRSFLGLDL